MNSATDTAQASADLQQESAAATTTDRRAGQLDSPSFGPSDDLRHPLSPCGPLEAEIFRNDLAAAEIFHRENTTTIPARHSEITVAVEGTEAELDSDDDGSGAPEASGREEGADASPLRPARVPLPGHSAVRLLLARLMDRNPDMVAALREGSPLVCIDAPARPVFELLKSRWKGVMLQGRATVVPFSALESRSVRSDYDAVSIVVGEPVKERDVRARDENAMAAYQLALPIIAITPGAQSHLSPLLLEAIDYRLDFPELDADTIRRTIEIVTGRECDDIPEQGVVAATGMHELALAVRFDRTSAQCLEALRKLARAKDMKRDSRDIPLDDLHGMDDAVAWARSSIKDLKDWKDGAIGWDAVDSGACLVGPPGTGKTSFARIFAATAGIPLITATLAKWQSSGDTHLGHLLRAMRADFDEARAKAPCVLFIDELDAFPVRDTISHSHRDYVVEVVNAFLEQLDGLAGRKGLIFIGATNAVERCDPAILRSGRLNRVIHIKLSGLNDLEKTLRVRLRGDLAGCDLGEVCLLALGSSGADIERIVKDARRMARQSTRDLDLADLLAAASGEVVELPAEMRRRTAVHEAAHIIMEVIHGGPVGVHARLGSSGDIAGCVTRLDRPKTSGTYDDYSKMLHIALAGRTAEEIVFSAPGHGAGGEETSDLAAATRMACAMIGSMGLAGPHPLVFLGPRTSTEKVLTSPYLRSAVQGELGKAADGVRAILLANRAALDKVAAHLLEHRRIDGEQVAVILQSERQVAPQHARNPARAKHGANPTSPLEAGSNMERSK
jgi:cell division protease FtsH